MAKPVLNGTPWLDDHGRPVNAHGAGLLQVDGRYYLFGEYKTDDENRFNGFSCYSSPDLATGTFEGMALPPQTQGLLGPSRIGERPKVMRNPRTGQFVMYAHTDDLKYMDPHIGIAVSDTVTGPYVPLGALQHDGEPVCAWDMGTFQDEDGTGYLLLHEGVIYRLADDYLSAVERVVEGVAPGGESPAMFRQDDLYYLLLSNKTMWERNDNYYLTAPAPHGPWTHRGLFAPEGSATHNSQCTFVFPLVVGGRKVPMYMGDRWSFPHQASAATYVWMPLTVDGERISIPELWPAWDPATAAPVELEGPFTPFPFASDTAGDGAETTFTGSQVALYGRVGKTSGYGTVTIRSAGDGSVVEQRLDFYSQNTAEALLYVSPELPEGAYTVRVEAAGTMSVCYTKAGIRYGADGSRVETTAIRVLR